MTAYAIHVYSVYTQQLMLFLRSQIYCTCRKVQEVACDACLGFCLTSGGGFEFAFLEGIKNIKVIQV